MVQQELKEALAMGEMLEKTGNNVWVGALTSEGAAYGPDWKTLVLQVLEWIGGIGVFLGGDSGEGGRQWRGPA